MYNDDIEIENYDYDDKGIDFSCYLQYTAEEAIKANLMALDWQEDSGVLKSKIFIDEDNYFFIVIAKRDAEKLHKKYLKGFFGEG